MGWLGGGPGGGTCAAVERLLEPKEEEVVGTELPLPCQSRVLCSDNGRVSHSISMLLRLVARGDLECQ